MCSTQLMVGPQKVMDPAVFQNALGDLSTGLFGFPAAGLHFESTVLPQLLLKLSLVS